MASSELLQYIQQSRTLGLDDGAIKTQLLQAGWQEKDILEGFAALGSASGIPGGAYQVSPKNKRLAIFFLIGPIVGLAIIFSAYAVAAYVISQLAGASGVGGGDIRSPIFLVVNIILGFLAIICVVGIIIGVIIAVILFNKKEFVSGVFDERSGKGKDSVIPDEIKGWNWGAFGLSIIWGVYYGAWPVLWGMLLGGIPVLGILWFVFVGMKGNEWAWRKNKWESMEKFKASQEKWKVWGILFGVLNILSVLSTFGMRILQESIQH